MTSRIVPKKRVRPLFFCINLFAFKINYNTTTENLGATALYNGNISETTWKTANDNTKRGYGFNYDAMNRLIKAKSSDGRYDLTSVSYDRNGNILTLQRKGTIVSSPDISRVNDFGIMDNLGYTYDVGNKLMRVTDTGNKTYGFKDGTNTNDDFAYDENGNMIIDRNKGITSMTYNHLNMPVEITFNNSSSKKISYVYDAYGIKLKKQVTNGASVTMTEYANNYIYENNELSFFDHKEGYVEPESDGTYTYIYEYKDHLGSVRLRYADNDKDGKIDVVRNGVDIDGDGDYTNEIREEKNYYPFGLVQKGYNYTIRGRKHNFGFNGKEEQNSLDFGMLDFGARNYDPALGRWMNIDPLAEFMPSFSPFSYAFDNPVLYIDIDGMLPMGPGDRVAAAKSINSSDTRTYKMVGGTAAYNDNYVDCSEFAREVALADGYDPGRDSRTQAKYYQENGQWVTNISEVKAGDFVYWRKPGTTRISHTGVVTRVNNDGTLHIIQSTYNKGGISINDKYNTSTDGALWKGGKYEREFVGAGRPAGEGFVGPLTLSQFEAANESFSLIIPDDEYIKYYKPYSDFLNRGKASDVSTITPGGITPSPTPGPIPGGGTIPVPTPAPIPVPTPIIIPPTPIVD
ncbi:RHS repeat-associated core domain-containing protein [Aquimarina macrocephali]|uniref:RHS repeat-associated core domain-containing protein n=1 Tax=Aquimarina macrocephali TaxID=666563 RepID=UPI003F6646D7